MKTITTMVDAGQYADYDDCLEAARRDYADEQGYEPWQVEASWADDERDEIALTVSVRSLASVVAEGDYIYEYDADTDGSRSMPAGMDEDVLDEIQHILAARGLRIATDDRGWRVAGERGEAR
jgi:hypothetical protein